MSFINFFFNDFIYFSEFGIFKINTLSRFAQSFTVVVVSVLSIIEIAIFLHLFLLGQPLQTNGVFLVLSHFTLKLLKWFPLIKILLDNIFLEMIVYVLPMISPIFLRLLFSLRLLSIIIL